MEGIIQLLPDALANKIAAGEVVQRPASVVKELLENSIDAGASKVQLIVKDAGKTLIQVIDDGKGMSFADARMCFERHATSKLKSADDLFNILTYGFRGEAMASIGSVAQVELRTKRADDELGVLLQIEGAEFKVQEPLAATQGTNIQVKNLFYNIPARRNFLKSNPVEMRHIIEEFQRTAMAYPSIAFVLMQNDMEVYNLPATKLSQRIVNIFGKNYQQQLVAVEEDTEYVKIKGYVGKPECAKKTRGEQFFFVNNRFIKHHYLHHAVTEAYNQMLPDKTHPFYCIFLEIDPSHVDVNVHPTKTEVKFDDERTLYAIINSAIKQALGIHHITPSIDFESDINLGVSTAGRRDYGNEKPPFEVPSFKTEDTPRQTSNSENWSNLYNGFDNNSGIEQPRASEEIVFSSGISDGTAKESHSSGVFQVAERFLASKVKSGVMLVEIKRAQERILFDKFSRYSKEKKAASQQCLFPQTLDLNPADFALLNELVPQLEALGFQIEEFGSNSVIINGVPTDIAEGGEKELIEGFIEQFKNSSGNDVGEVGERVRITMAKRRAELAVRTLSSMEQEALINELFASENPNYTPDGKNTFVMLGQEELLNLFN